MKGYEKLSFGFTIVELLVVIVVIGILAAISIVSYTGISQKAVVASIQNDLNNASKQLKLYYTTYGTYPALDGNNCPSAPTVDNSYCLKSSSGNSFSYSSIASNTFRLTNTNSNVSYSLTDNSAPFVSTTPNGSSVGSACPSGFIPVPGSGTYGTSDFCVMKYEAKNDGSNNAISQESSAPWTSITQVSAVSTSASACINCHLITEAEWLTIAQNVLSVNANWSGGSVGSGCIFRGNVGLNDTCGYDGSDPESGSGRNTKASLTLTNGEVIWDFAGNVREWTNITFTGGQPGNIGGGETWRQWNSVTTHGTMLPDPHPTTTGITGASSWTSTHGIGNIYSNADDTTTLTAPYRGGYWSNTENAGVLAASLGGSPTAFSNANTGFRVAK